MRLRFHHTWWDRRFVTILMSGTSRFCRRTFGAKACRIFMDAKPDSLGKISSGGFGAVVNGFTGSSIWHSIYAFPPTDQKYWQKGFDDFARRFKPILDEFDRVDIN